MYIYLIYKWEHAAGTVWYPHFSSMAGCPPWAVSDYASSL